MKETVIEALKQRIEKSVSKHGPSDFVDGIHEAIFIVDNNLSLDNLDSEELAVYLDHNTHRVHEFLSAFTTDELEEHLARRRGL